MIDEIQRIPALLDEVHRLYEQHRGIHFALSGASARKLRRAGANLLAGRALQHQMLPFVWPEYHKAWSIDQACEWGTLPLVVSDPGHRGATLATYVETYLKEEITAESLVRSLNPFVRVLQVAGLYNGQILNLENLSRESEVKRSTVERYFQILEDGRDLSLFGKRQLRCGFPRADEAEDAFRTATVRGDRGEARKEVQASMDRRPADAPPGMRQPDPAGYRRLYGERQTGK